MPMQAHMSLEGTEQGKIEGSVDQKGREGTIYVEQFEHKIYMPNDPQSGMPTGNAVHQPMKVHKFFDKSSPKLYKALSRGERRPLDPPALVLARHRADRDHFDVLLSLRHGGTVFRLTGVSANDASRAKAIAVALAAWLDASLTEGSSPKALEALRDTDLHHRLVLPDTEPDAVNESKPPTRSSRRRETVVDVAVFAVELLNAL